MMSGEPSTEVLLVESGAVKVVLLAPNGSESIVGILGPGELLGELGVMSGRPRNATVVGHLDGVAWHVARDVFLRLLERDRDISVLINNTLQDRLYHADNRQLAFAALDVPTRVAAQLLTWARSHGEQVDGGLRVHGMTQRDLALAVTASEKTVEAVLRDLRAAGLVRTSRRAYLLPDPVALERLLRQHGWTPES